MAPKLNSKASCWSVLKNILGWSSDPLFPIS